MTPRTPPRRSRSACRSIPSQQTVALAKSAGEAAFIVPTAGRPGASTGTPSATPIVTRDPPHAGEMHPDGDEVLFVVSGAIRRPRSSSPERRAEPST